VTAPRSISIPLPADSYSGVLSWIARSMLAAECHGVDAARWAEQRGAPARVTDILTKTNIPAATTSGSGYVAPIAGCYALAISAFLGSMSNASAFFSILNLGAGGFTVVPFNLRAGIVTAGATGFVIGAGRPTPLSRLTLANGLLTPHTVASLMVTTDEVLNDVSAAGQTLFSNELKAAVGVEVDQLFIDDCATTGIEDISGSSSDAGNVRAALFNALSIISPTQRSRIFWIGARDTVLTLACMSANDLVAFPEVGIDGGTLLGRPLLVSDACDSGKMYCIDASRIAANADEIAMRTSTSASIEMSDAPTNNSATPTAASLVSMFATNSVALLCSVRVACELLDTDAVVVITGLAASPTTT
jgi:HK97 family phage major capsid protein